MEQVKTRRNRDRDRLDQGLVTNPKDIERMQAEMVSLERRISSLEDDEIEVMERLEGAQGMLDSAQSQVSEVDERLGALVTSRDEAVARIDEELAGVVERREPMAAQLPDDLLALYEKLRAAKGGVGAALLHQRRCTGCQLGLDASVLAEIRATAPDQVVRCEECSRILVRTAESGL